MTVNQIRDWALRWMAAKRPNEIKPAWLTEMLEAFQEKLEGDDHAADKRNQQSYGE
jgi:hypothetical protein